MKGSGGLKSLFVAVLASALTVFAVQNHTAVTIRVLVWQLAGMSLAAVILLSAAAGIVLVGVPLWIDRWRLRTRLRALEAKVVAAADTARADHGGVGDVGGPRVEEVEPGRVVVDCGRSGNRHGEALADRERPAHRGRRGSRDAAPLCHRPAPAARAVLDGQSEGQARERVAGSSPPQRSARVARAGRPVTAHRPPPPVPLPPGSAWPGPGTSPP